jgi:hypothetical protein
MHDHTLHNIPLGGIKPSVLNSILDQNPTDCRCTIANGIHIAMGNPQLGLKSAPAPGFPPWMDQQEVFKVFVWCEAELYLLESKGLSQ